MKGLSPFVSGVMIVAITVVITLIVGNFIIATGKNASTEIGSQVEQKLRCSYANFYIENATYDCNNNCSAGVVHTLNITLRNTGRTNLQFRTAQILNTTGGVFVFSMPANVNVGNIVTLTNTSKDSCYGINHTIEKIFIGAINCPVSDSIDSDYIVYVRC